MSKLTLPTALVLLRAFFIRLCAVAYADLSSEFDAKFGGQRVKIDGGNLYLSLDAVSGSGFASKQEYLFGKIDMQIKLVPGNSAGTVTTYYLSSPGQNQDEVDFEFLGNVSGQPYVLHTNIFTRGKGEREQQFYLWFDPRDDFHTYSVLWNPHLILLAVDGIPIRVFKNNEGKGIPFPKDQPMRLYSTIWNGDSWATRGGRDKIDWRLAPFTASYRTFRADGCVWGGGRPSCPPTSRVWMNHGLDANQVRKLNWVQKNYMIYNYCSDSKRSPHGFPPECNIPIC